MLTVDFDCLFPAIIVTGGGFTDNETQLSVEVLKKEGTSWTSCSLPDLPDTRYGPTQNGLITCGGLYDNPQVCLSFMDGQWKQSHYLAKARMQHSAWKSSEGILLMGGSYTPSTTELLNDNGLTTRQFNLKYEAK